MGLAAPKNRAKISNDPQNTTWANNTSRFGHRILTSQGWQQGDALGATDASHAAHYTAASQSHIRVFLKDDNLGLGAKRGSQRAENFGLAGLESILGRLNGKEEEVKKEEERREKIEQRAYVYKKLGFMNFVSGGFLVGDKITKSPDAGKEPEIKIEIKSEPESDDNGADKTSKKRKRGEQSELEPLKDGAEDEPSLKRKKKSMDLREEAKKDLDRDKSKTKKDKKEKKSKKEKSRKSSSDPEPSTSQLPTPASDPEGLTEKSKRKAEKKVRKEEKKLKKALKKAAKKAAKRNASNESSSESEDEESAPSVSAPSLPTTGNSTPMLSSAGLTFNSSNARGMHAVRQKWIRQKKAATMDAQAMKEIFMIKAPS